MLDLPRRWQNNPDELPTKLPVAAPAADIDCITNRPRSLNWIVLFGIISRNINQSVLLTHCSGLLNKGDIRIMVTLARHGNPSYRKKSVMSVSKKIYL